MATAEAFTVTVKLPNITKQAIEALRDVTAICQKAEEAGLSSVSIEAIADVVESFLDTASAGVDA